MKNALLRNTLFKLARAHRPYEVCGLLAARPGQPVSWVAPMANVHADRMSYFAMDDDELIDMYGRVERMGFTVVGYWHSHVTTPAEPSGYDLAHAVPDMISVIVSLAGDGDIRAWHGQLEYGGDLLD